MSHINFLHEGAKRNHLINEISRNLKLEPAQQSTKIKHKIKPMYDNNHGKTIKGIEKEISYLKGEFANKNPLLSSLRNKNSACFLQGDAFPQKPTEESNENIDFAIDTPPQCLTIPLNYANCDEGDDLLKTKLDEQLKEICKCHHQKYLNTKPIINNVNKSKYLEQKRELIIEKYNDNVETYIESIIESKVARNEETKSVGKTTFCEEPPPEKLINFHEIQRNFHNNENYNNEENRLIAKDNNIENNNNEDDRPRTNDSNIDGNNESIAKSNQGKLAFILGDSMVKDVDSYLLMGSINRKFTVKVRPFSSAKLLVWQVTPNPPKETSTQIYKYYM